MHHRFVPMPDLEPFGPPVDDGAPAPPGDEWDVEPVRHEAVPAVADEALDALDDAALAELIYRVMRQDEAALAVLYEQLSGRVYALSLRITRQVACAEEVLQDTFWQVWRQAPRFDPQRGVATAWVMMMARSRALDALRSRSRDPVHASQPLPEDGAALAGQGQAQPKADPLDLLLAVRRDGALHAQLAKLEPARRQLVALAFFKGMTHDQIAEHTGLPLGTVKSTLRRTLVGLQAALGPEFKQVTAGVGHDA